MANNTIQGPGTLYHLREELESGPGPFTVSNDGVYFVDDTPVLITFEIEARKSALWQAYLDSFYREDLAPFIEVRRQLIAAQTLFAKNDFYGADRKLWK